MNNALDFLTEDQLNVELTPSGSYVNENGDWAEAETLGSELERFFKKHQEPLIHAVAEFSVREKEDGTEDEYGRVSHFMAWTDSYLLVVLDSLFNDQYLAVLPRNPPKAQP